MHARGEPPDWRRRVLELPSEGPITQGAVRAAYWRLVRRGVAEATRATDMLRLKTAKEQLLFELGQRVPGKRPTREALA